MTASATTHSRSNGDFPEPPRIGGVLRVGFVSRSPRLELRRLFGPFVSGLKIPFPGNGDLGSKRLGSNACFSDPEDEQFRVLMRVLVSWKTEHFHVAAVRQPAASIGVETSMPSTSQEGPARSASAIELAPVPQPISTTRSPGRSCARVWAELQVVAILRTVGSVVEVGYLVAAVCDWRESVVRVHDGFDEYLVSFGALSASRRSLLVLTTNEGRQLAGPRAGIPSLGLGSFACPRDGKNNVISQNETLRRRDHPIDVE